MRTTLALTLLYGTLTAASSTAPEDEGYRLPPQEVVDLIDAAPAPSVSLSPDGHWMLLIERDALPPIADLARRVLRLAGTRIDPAAHGPFRSRYAKGLALRRIGDEQSTHLALPEGSRLDQVSWSHDSQHFAYTLVTDEGTELYAAGVHTAGVPRRLSARLNTTLAGFTWMPSGREILFPEVPEEHGDEPAAARAPSGPNVRSTAGQSSPLRTYQDLLSSPHDERLFEHYATARLVLAAVDGSLRKPLGAPALFTSVRPSPDGEHFLVTRLGRPFSYVMPWWRFPSTIEVWNHDAGVVRTVAEVPLGESIPIGGVRTGPRSVGWTPDGQLQWVEALDGGDPKREVEHRDRWMLAAATGGDPRELVRVEHRARGLSWFEDPDRFLTSEYDRDRRWSRSLYYDRRGDADAAPQVIEDRSVRDRYGDPGRLVYHRAENGYPFVSEMEGQVLRTGSGASPRGLLPFLDRQDLGSLQTERLWRCEEGSYESVVQVLVNGIDVVFTTRHESPSSPPNYVRHADGKRHPLTAFPDPTPQARGITKELVTYERADGVPLSATLYLPADHRQGERLPLFVWAYPIEYNDPSTAGQVGSTPWRFTRIAGASHLALLTQGWAVLDGATMPVIGDPETMNDTFVEQIVGAAQAAIDFAVERGVADRDRVACGGHSYGAFMTANLLAHCDLFRAGVARSGAYNRTLTPFGFQSERRTIWEAPEAYFKVSPFFHADQIDEALLLIHGEVDNNSGTYPMQSERLFSALKGNGGTARLVMLPHESHGYRARESILHTHAETIEWLDRYVKQAAPRAIEAGAKNADEGR